MRILLLTCSLFVFTNICFGQLVSDAIRFSAYEHVGTARTVGIGGAISALGSDFSALSLNPGGLGNYRSSEFVVTPFLNINTSEAALNGAALNDSRLKFGFQNFGLCLS